MRAALYEVGAARVLGQGGDHAYAALRRCRLASMTAQTLVISHQIGTQHRDRGQPGGLPRPAALGQCGADHEDVDRLFAIKFRQIAGNRVAVARIGRDGLDQRAAMMAIGAVAA